MPWGRHEGDYTDNSATVDYIEMEFNGSNCRVGIKMVPLEELLAISDAISVHVNSKGDGKFALGEEEFAKMKPGVVLVNTARGNSIDEKVLIAALKDGRVKAAGLDVFMDEPTPHAELLTLPNVCLSPHIGAATRSTGTGGNELADLPISWRDEVTVGRSRCLSGLGAQRPILRTWWVRVPS